MAMHAVLDRNDTEQAVDVVQTDLAQLVQRGMAGDREVLPAIREMLNQSPSLLQQVSTLATQLEQTWIKTLAGDDLVTREVLTRQVDMLKATLAGPHPSPLETLLIERIATCFLALHHAEFRTTKRLRHSRVLSTSEENRLDKVQKRYLDSVKSLAQVRKLLMPKVQVNLAQNQINIV